jgi:hypothetical protein
VTTSGVITSQLLVSEIVQAAMQELAVLSAGESPTAEEVQDSIRVMNWMFKSWPARGLNLWRETQGEVVIPAATASIALDPYCLDVVEARFVQSSTFERPLARWEAGQYRQIPNKVQPGYPVAYYLDKQTTGISLTLWPVPVADATILYTYSRIPQDVTDGAETVDVPQEWTELVYVALAARLVQTFGVNRTDPATAQIIAQRAAALEQQMLDQDRPASVFMGSAMGRNF